MDSVKALNPFIEQIPVSSDYLVEKIHLLESFLRHKDILREPILIRDKLIQLRSIEKKALDKQISDAVFQAKKVNDLIQKEKDLNQFLLHENNHRIKNNLQIILSIISLSKYSDEDPKKIFADIESRLKAISTLQDYINNNNAIIKKDALSDIINDLLSQLDSNIGFQMNLKFKNDVKFSNEFLSSFAIMLNEMVTNSIKHAFNTGISNRLELQLSIQDDVFYLNYNDYSMVNSETKRNLGLDIIDASISKHNGIRKFSFKAEEKRSDVVSVKFLCQSQKIEWTTSKEMKNNYFRIQGSNNSFSWSNIRTKKGKGHNQQSGYQKYQLKVNEVYKYYRLLEFNSEGDDYAHTILKNSCQQ